ncbi:phosphomevalonate kinase [Schaalia vaccimaxillae]|uniref:phosphomevalonate kinase n=1 Tax=Schaalia vaccimaxillae TaxID=183916 RepID=UPI0003B7950F|nr:phosphomevalonate kinase [Schaalia vaccimaxillae]
MTRSVSCQAPGKLFITGEYAVVEPGHSALLVSVNRFITVTATATEGPAARISSTLYEGGQRTWTRDSHGVAIQQPDDLDYVLSALRVVEEVARTGGLVTEMFHLDVDSQLVDDEGVKLGLGSSAAVTVATVRAVAAFHGLQVSDLDVCKMALLASDTVEPIGSGGDIAASSFTGWVRYSSPDRQWLRRKRRTMSVADLVRSEWPGLRVERINIPADINLLVGWTREPASTPYLVANVQDRAQEDATSVNDYQGFLASSDACVDELVHALQSRNFAAVAQAVAVSRHLLQDLMRASGVVIETAELTRLVEIACAHGAAAKSSGAGGGDCGIALHGSHTSADALRKAWSEAGILPLDLVVWTRPEESR